MTYKESQIILGKIKAAEKILINCHVRPDVDSISSALSMCQALHQLGKKSRVICPDDPLPELHFLSCFEDFEKMDFSKFDFKNYDLFIILDSAREEVVVGKKDQSLPDMEIVNIDHHRDNSSFGAINLIDDTRSSAAELLYLLFKDWNIEINREIATSLLTGILGDTGAFEYHNTTSRTLQVAADLMDLGADKDEILLKIFRSKQMNLLKFWGQVLDTMKLDESGKFTWCAIPYEVYVKLGKPQMARESASNSFARMLEDTEFGIIMLEEEPNTLRASLRSREKGFDVSKIAEKLGGGGHPGSAGVSMVDVNFNSEVEKVVSIARQFV